MSANTLDSVVSSNDIDEVDQLQVSVQVLPQKRPRGRPPKTSAATVSPTLTPVTSSVSPNLTTCTGTTVSTSSSSLVPIVAAIPTKVAGQRKSSRTRRPSESTRTLSNTTSAPATIASSSVPSSVNDTSVSESRPKRPVKIRASPWGASSQSKKRKKAPIPTNANNSNKISKSKTKTVTTTGTVSTTTTATAIDNNNSASSAPTQRQASRIRIVARPKTVSTGLTEGVLRRKLSSVGTDLDLKWPLAGKGLCILFSLDFHEKKSGRWTNRQFLHKYDVVIYECKPRSEHALKIYVSNGQCCHSANRIAITDTLVQLSAAYTKTPLDTAKSFKITSKCATSGCDGTCQPPKPRGNIDTRTPGSTHCDTCHSHCHSDHLEIGKHESIHHLEIDIEHYTVCGSSSIVKE